MVSQHAVDPDRFALVELYFPAFRPFAHVVDCRLATASLYELCTERIAVSSANIASVVFASLGLGMSYEIRYKSGSRTLPCGIPALIPHS